MTKKFNPFEAWLGFDASDVKPDYFELFGVERSPEDPVAFRRQVRARGKKLLAKLDAMSDKQIGSRSELHARLRKYLIQAHDTLQNPQLRDLYLEKLEEDFENQQPASLSASAAGGSSAATQRRRRGSSSASLTMKDSSPISITTEISVDAEPKRSNKADAARSNKTKATGSTKADSKRSSKAKRTAKPPAAKKVKRPPTAGSESIPMAVPMAKPVNTTDGKSVNTTNGKSNASQPAGPGIKTNSLSQIPAIERTSSRRKRSWIVPIFCCLLFLAGIGGLLGLVFEFDFNWEKAGFPEFAQQEEEVDVVKQPAAIAPVKTTAPAPPNSFASTKPTPAAPQPAVVARPPVNLGLPSTVTIASAAPSKKPDAAGSNSTAVRPPSPPAAPTNRLDAAELHTVRYFIQRAEFAMRRGQLVEASRQFSNVDKMLGGNLAGDQAVLNQRLRQGREFLKQIEGFWEQVRASSKRIPTGELEVRPGTFVGFVEARQKSVILRMGENVEIPYQSLRPLLAIRMVEAHAVPESPEWLLQKAAFEFLHIKSDDKKMIAELRELITEAESAGVEVAAVQGYMSGDWLKVFPSPTRTPISKNEFRDLTDQVQGRHYRNVFGLSSPEAYRIATSFSTKVWQDPRERIVGLTESVKLFSQANGAFEMFDAIDELSLWSDIDAGAMKYDGVKRINQGDLDADSSRQLCEAFLELLKTDQAKRVSPRRLDQLRLSLVNTAKHFRITDVRRRLEQATPTGK